MSSIKFHLYNFIFCTIYCVSIVFASDLRCDKAEKKNPDDKIKDYLFCDYDTSIRPYSFNKSAVEIRIRGEPIAIKWNWEKQAFSIDILILISWTDDELKWDNSKFENRESIKISGNDIWTPDLFLHNSADLTEEESRISYEKCMLTHTGRINCVIESTFDIKCDAESKMWPYDTHNCSIKIIAWTHRKLNFTIGKYKRGIYMYAYNPNWKWKLVSQGMSFDTYAYHFKPDEYSGMVTINFFLERVVSNYYWTFITPIFVLSITTLTTLWLDVRTRERMILACINLLCHSCALTNCYWRLPYTADTPHIFILYEYSFILAALCLLLSVILCEVRNMKCSPPVLIASTTSFVLKSRVGKVLTLSILDPRATANLDFDDLDDNLNLLNSSKKQNVWDYVVLLIGWFAFLVMAFIYIILLSVYFPRKMY